MILPARLMGLSWAAYNLIGACAARQTELFSILPYWPASISIALNQTIPFYAGLNPNRWTGQLFNAQEAQLIADKYKDNPDLTGAPNADIEALDPQPVQQRKAEPIAVIIGSVVGGVIYPRPDHAPGFLHPFLDYRVEPLPLLNDELEKHPKKSRSKSERVKPFVTAVSSSEDNTRDNTTANNEAQTAPSEVGHSSDTASRLRDEVQNLRREIEEMRLGINNDPPPEYS
ncbi:hypothetical protein L218DRAFT_1059978 [Marasmius fiardii PR-910]|nr:hypothetical protein L218DRAFT_1059978 [Marasmius fiardii PR-910]